MYGPVFNYTPGSTMGVGQSSESSSTSPFSKPYSTDKSEDTLSISGSGEKKKSQGFMGAITDFGKGIVKGAYNAVSSLFTVKGMLLALGTLGLVAVAPAVVIPLLVAGGVVMGGSQIASGVSTGDWEKAGEGTFTLGATMLGARFGPKTAKGAGDSKYAFVKTSKKDGVTTLSKPSGIFGTTWANIKSVFGSKMGRLDKDGNLMTTADGKLAESKTIYQLGKERLSKKQAGGGAAGAGAAAEEVKPSTEGELEQSKSRMDEVDDGDPALQYLDEAGKAEYRALMDSDAPLDLDAMNASMGKPPQSTGSTSQVSSLPEPRKTTTDTTEDLVDTTRPTPRKTKSRKRSAKPSNGMSIKKGIMYGLVGGAGYMATRGVTMESGLQAATEFGTHMPTNLSTNLTNATGHTLFPEVPPLNLSSFGESGFRGFSNGFGDMSTTHVNIPDIPGQPFGQYSLRGVSNDFGNMSTPYVTFSDIPSQPFGQSSIGNTSFNNATFGNVADSNVTSYANWSNPSVESSDGIMSYVDDITSSVTNGAKSGVNWVSETVGPSLSQASDTVKTNANWAMQTFGPAIAQTKNGVTSWVGQFTGGGKTQATATTMPLTSSSNITQTGLSQAGNVTEPAVLKAPTGIEAEQSQANTSMSSVTQSTILPSKETSQASTVKGLSNSERWDSIMSDYDSLTGPVTEEVQPKPTSTSAAKSSANMDPWGGVMSQLDELIGPTTQELQSAPTLTSSKKASVTPDRWDSVMSQFDEVIGPTTQELQSAPTLTSSTQASVTPDRWDSVMSQFDEVIGPTTKGLQPRSTSKVQTPTFSKTSLTRSTQPTQMADKDGYLSDDDEFFECE